MLIRSGHKTSAFAGIIEVEKVGLQEVKKCLKELCQQNNLTNTELAMFVPEQKTEKYDKFLPKSLLAEGYGQKYFDIDNSILWLKEQLFL